MSAICRRWRVFFLEVRLRAVSSVLAAAPVKGKDLPSRSHVVRNVKPSMIREDGTVFDAAYCLRLNRPDENGISVNWLEAFAGSKRIQLSHVRRLHRLNVRRTGRFAEINVGELRQKVGTLLKTLRVVHDPLDAEGDYEPDPAHAEIIGLPIGNSLEAEFIGEKISRCVRGMHPAIDLSIVK